MLYRAFAYFGLASIFGAILHGFRYDPTAPAGNYVIDLLLFALWALIHLGMTAKTFKRVVFGDRAGSLYERQVYIAVTVVTWLGLLAIHRPVSGGSLALPSIFAFAGHVGFILAVLAFFEGATFAALDGLLGAPGAAMSHSHGGETPLLTEGQYARVRHPMYRAAILAALCSFLIHPNTAQVLWCGMIGAVFVGFVPIEERLLLTARGESYRAYMERTPWRLFPGVW